MGISNTPAALTNQLVFRGLGVRSGSLMNNETFITNQQQTQSISIRSTDNVICPKVIRILSFPPFIGHQT